MKEFRPRIPNTEDWKELIDFAREYGADDVLEAFLKSRNNTKEEHEFRNEGMDYIITSQAERVMTLEDLVEATDVDQDQFEIYRYITNKWDQHSVDKGLVELFQVKAWMKKKYLDQPDPAFYDDWLDALDKMVTMPEIHSVSSEKPIVLAFADLHAGSFISKEKLVPDYNLKVLEERLDHIASVVNSYDRPVHVKLLGDLIESFTGKNHKDTWKQIEKHGMEVALIVFDLLHSFIQKLDKFVDLEIIGGNHDRISSSNQDDKRGQVAYLVNGMLKRIGNGIDTKFHHRLLSSNHDGVQYIITHGDKKVAKKDANQMVLEFGDQDSFNVMLTAHKHDERIIENTVKFKSLQIPAIVPPNEYALDNGWTSSNGFVVLTANEAGNVDVHTHGL